MFGIMYRRETYADFLYDEVINGSGKPKFIASRVGNSYDERFWDEGEEVWEFANIMPENVLRSFNNLIKSFIKKEDVNYFPIDAKTGKRFALIKDHVDYFGKVLGVEINKAYALGNTVKVINNSDITDKMIRDFEIVRDFVKSFGYNKGIDSIELISDLVGDIKSVHLIGEDAFNADCVIVARN